MKYKVFKFLFGGMLYSELGILISRVKEAGYSLSTNFALHDMEEAKEISFYVHNE